jgi:hypothetical protein
MMGYILYETIGLAYNITKLTCNTITATYNWYYVIDTNNTTNVDINSKLNEMRKALSDLDEKYKLLSVEIATHTKQIEIETHTNQIEIETHTKKLEI